MAVNPSQSPGHENLSQGLSSRIQALLGKVQKDLEKRRRATERTMEDVDRRLRHVAFLVADLDLRCVIPKLTELAAMFPQATQPKKEGVCDRISVDFLPTEEYPAQARVCVGMTPLPFAEKLRVTFSVVMLPVHLPYEGEAWIDLVVENPDTKSLERFLDDRIVQFVADYIKVRNPESPYHEDQKVTDPVCGMTFSVAEAAASLVHDSRTYYFCVEGCRRKFASAPEHYLIRPSAIKEMPSQERAPLLYASPAEGISRVKDRRTGSGGGGPGGREGS